MTPQTTASANGWSRLTVEAQNEIMAGGLAIQQIRRREDYHQWIAAGRALLRLEEEAKFLSGSNGPFGRAYTAVRRELGQHVPDLEALDNPSKAHAKWLAQNFAPVEGWLATLAVNQRDRLNHPTAIKRRFEAAHRTAAPSVDTPRPPTPGEKLKTENVRLQEELDTAHRKLHRAERDSGPQITRTDTTDDIARVLLEWLPDSKVRPVASKMLAALKSTEPAKARRPAKTEG